MTREQALEAFTAARDAAADAWQVWCGNCDAGEPRDVTGPLRVRYLDLLRAEHEARADLDKITHLEKTHGHGG